MKYVDDFRDAGLARQISERIAREAAGGRGYRFMEFCGGHTHALLRYGLLDLLPEAIQMVHGPGCPVCVLPVGRVDQAIALARLPGVVLCSYADMMRVPGSERVSLLKAKAEGADVRMVYSTSDALSIARAAPELQIVFFAIGFETTTPPTAVAIREAQRDGLRNFSVFCNHVLTPPAIASILGDSTAAGEPVPLDGFVGPAHVSTVIGTRPYERFAERHHKPVVIAGFEPLDMLQAIAMLVRQVNDGRAEVENEYSRVVTRDGNLKAQALMSEVFELRSEFEWRGLGVLPRSALQIRPHLAEFDAERRFDVTDQGGEDHRACECADIVRGIKRPADCKLFGRACTPESPMGACMVSSEGACAAHYSYGRFRETSA